MKKELTESTIEGIDQLTKKWNAEKNQLEEEFSRIYEKKSSQKGKEWDSEEEKQAQVMKHLAIQVAVDEKKENPVTMPHNSEGGVDLSLYKEDETKLDPLSYSTGKTQAEIIDEILESFESADMVFLKGVVGSGKSVVGIRTALELGGGTISVPTKILSHQYQKDYEGKNYFMSDGGEKIKIGILKGRGNFTCPYIRDKYPESEYDSCQNRSLPCTRPLSIEESRMEALRECPYWGFILPSSNRVRKRKEHVGNYKSLIGKHSVLLKGGCPYWNQYKNYLGSPVNVLNSAKWEIEARIGRLPSTEITVIDEADQWLDGLCSRVRLTDRKIRYLIEDLRETGLGQEAKTVNDIWTSYKNGFEEPLDIAENLHKIMEGTDTGSKLYWHLKRVLNFEEDIVTETEENSITYHIPDPKPVLSELREWIGGKWLLMSATVQDEEVLNEVYDIDPIFVKGETEFPGRLIQRKIGAEVGVNNRKWKSQLFRRRYQKTRDEIFKRARRPGFVPVHATKYLPEDIQNLTEKNEMEVDGLKFSTKMDRGADLGDMESIILLKYPYPGLGDPLLKAIRKRLGEKKFWMYYRDQTRREFIQQVGRTLRSPDDIVEFWSPDDKCHEMLGEDWGGEIVKENTTRNQEQMRQNK